VETSDPRSSSACIVHLFPRADAMQAIPEDNSKLGRESPLDLLLRRRQRRREAVFSDHIDRHDSREFLKVTRAFPLPRVSSKAARRAMHAREKVTARIAKRESRVTQDCGVAWKIPAVEQARRTSVSVSTIAESQAEACSLHGNESAGWRKWKSRENSCSLLLR